MTQLVVLGIGAVIALSTVTACGKRDESLVAAMPQKATFVGKLPAKEGRPQMAVAVSVDGDRVAAYACNNANDEAWFFGIRV